MHSAFDLIGSYTGLLIFEVAGIDYCLNDSIVFSTVKPPFEISRCGKGSGNEDRVIKVNERLIPLIDLKTILNPKLKSTKTTRSSRVIIIENENEEFGFLVDKIKEIMALDSKYIFNCIKLLPDTEPTKTYEGNNYTKGSLEIDNRCILLLDAKQIISSMALSIN